MSIFYKIQKRFIHLHIFLLDNPQLLEKLTSPLSTPRPEKFKKYHDKT